MDYEALRSRIFEQTRDALKKQGITPFYVAKKLKQLTGATRKQVAFSTHDEKFYYSKKMPDNRAQLDATKTCAQVLDMFPSERMEHSFNLDELVSVLPEPFVARLRERLKAKAEEQRPKPKGKRKRK